jgi:hypothetical protein
MPRNNNNECEEDYTGPERRKHCEMVVALKTAYDEDKRDRDKWREEVDNKLETIITFLHKIEGPYNAGLWAMRILLGGLITGFVALIWRILNSHFK